MTETPEIAVVESHWLNAERLRVYPRVFLALYLLLTAVWVLLSRHGVDITGKPLGHDFIAFWTASELALAGHPLAAYDPETLVAAQQALLPGIRTAHPWQYPPTFLLAVLPLALLPYFASYLLFVASTLFVYAAVWRRIAPPQAGLILLLAFPGVYQNALHGQNGFLTAALIGGALLSLPSRPMLAGVLFGLLAIKPHLGLLVPLALVCGRQWRALASAALTVPVFVGLSLLVLGSETMTAFLERLPIVAQWVAENRLPLNKMPTFFAFARLLGAPVSYAYAGHFAVALPVAAVVALIWYRHDPRDQALPAAALTAGSLLISPYLFDYDLVWLALPLAWFAACAMRDGWRRGERAWLLAIWLLPALVAALHATLKLQLAPFALLGFFILIAHRALVPAAGGLPCPR